MNPNASPQEIVDAIQALDNVRPGLAYDVGKLLLKLNPRKTIPVPMPPMVRIRLTGVLTDDKTRALFGLRKFFKGDYETTQALYKKLLKEGLDAGTARTDDGGADVVIRTYARYDILAEALPYDQNLTETLSLSDSFACTG